MHALIIQYDLGYSVRCFWYLQQTPKSVDSTAIAQVTTHINPIEASRWKGYDEANAEEQHSFPPVCDPC